MANVISLNPQQTRAKSLRIIDLDAPDARKKLLAVHPVVTRDELLPATVDAADWIDRYESARKAEREAAVDKEQAAAHVCAAIASAAGIVAGEVKATWLEQRGAIDWESLATECGIDEETIERFRRPPTRVLRVAPLAANERGRR